MTLRPPPIRIDVACNDPDNGRFAGRAEMIQVGLPFLELTARREPAPRFVEIPGRFRLSGRTWPVANSREWFGNWCWNAYWLELPHAVDFLIWLHGRELFHCDQAEARLFSLWHGRKPLPRPFIERQLAKLAREAESRIATNAARPGPRLL